MSAFDPQKNTEATDVPFQTTSAGSDVVSSTVDATYVRSKPVTSSVAGSTQTAAIHQADTTPMSSENTQVADVKDIPDSQSTENSSETMPKSGQTKALPGWRRRFKEFTTKYRKPIRITALIIGLAGLGVFGTMSVWAVDVWNNKSSLQDLGKQPAQSSVVYAFDGQTELFRFYDEENREVIPLEQISPNMQLAIVALEDENFWYNESGIPWTNLVGAATKCILPGGDTCRGASGLSQQLIKNVKRDDEGSIQRKVRELFTAIKLNQEKSKPEILADYLNWVPFGRNAYGVQQASKTYYGKSAADLDPAEACYLASMVQRPSYFNSGINNPESAAYAELRARKNACLQKIYELTLDPNLTDKPIKSAEDLQALQEKEVAFLPNVRSAKYPHFRDFVTQELTKFVDEQDLLTGGYRIITTLDPATQDMTQSSIDKAKDRDIYANGANNAAVLVLDGPTGEIRAMVGSLDYNSEDIDGQVNVVTAPRQPGSSIKPYVYAAAMEKSNLNPASRLLDVQTTFEPNFTPKNFSGGFVGPTTIRSSLANSYNIPAVKAAYLASSSPTPNASAGINEVFDYAEKMGVNFPCIPLADGSACENPDQAPRAYRNRCNISASLGGCEVTMLSHLTGINTFAQDGNLRTATPFRQIIDSQGVDIYAQIQRDNPVYKQQDAVIDPLVARQISSILSDYNARRPAFGSSARRLELDGWNGDNAVAAKTGTTNDVKDTWTVGYSPYYSVSVWVGNTDSTPLNQRATSVGTTSGIWNDVMRELHGGKDKRGFSKEGLQAVRLNPQTYLPDPEGGVVELMTPKQIEFLQKAKANSEQENYQPGQNNYFVNGTVIAAKKVKINKIDEKLAVEGKTLPDNIEEREFLELVSEYPRASNWQAAAEAIMGREETAFQRPPTEESDQDQVTAAETGTEINSNLDRSLENVDEVTIRVDLTGQGRSVVALEIWVDGQRVSTGQSGTLTWKDIQPFTDGREHTVLVKMMDNWNIRKEKSYSKVTFSSATPRPLTVQDIPDLQASCTSPTTTTPRVSSSTVDCSFSLPTRVTLPTTFRLRVDEDDDNGATCRVSGSSAVCAGVKLPSTPGTYPIQAKIGSGSFLDTAGEYELVQ